MLSSTKVMSVSSGGGIGVDAMVKWGDRKEWQRDEETKMGTAPPCLQEIDR
jgi:hypothetical protein